MGVFLKDTESSFVLRRLPHVHGGVSREWDYLDGRCKSSPFMGDWKGIGFDRGKPQLITRAPEKTLLLRNRSAGESALLIVNIFIVG